MLKAKVFLLPLSNNFDILFYHIILYKHKYYYNKSIEYKNLNTILFFTANLIYIIVYLFLNLDSITINLSNNN